MLKTYRRGLTEPAQLETFCRVAALNSYAVGKRSAVSALRYASIGIDYEQNIQLIARSKELLEKTAVLTRTYVPRL